jgi:hypothetical protein
VGLEVEEGIIVLVEVEEGEGVIELDQFLIQMHQDH